MRRGFQQGFTLIELMIVLTIIGVIMAIAIPKFGTLMNKSKESNTKGNLGAIRSALSVYYGESEGNYPADNLASLLAGAKYLPEMPMTNLPPTTNSPGHGGGAISGVIIGAIPAALTDVADGVSGWLYDNSPGNLFYGHVIVNCSHSDYYGDPWTSF